ncbi:tetratricopeptide repeat protein [uncultured Brachyspira sp.]|uniref:tetratricopeptide repeat protein n=1 Tax=uncultured Brachyspira sp. TaxID=221953 RepID=UPI00262F2F7A|nr:tetratricopeptide repeat protein [uncultured Brachyspira sp.]
MSVVNDNDSGRDSEYYFDRANIFSLEGKYEEAIVYYNKAIELDPNYTDAYNGRGKAKNDLGKYEDSIKDFNKVIELTPNYTNAYYDRGNAKKIR